MCEEGINYEGNRSIRSHLAQTRDIEDCRIVSFLVAEVEREGSHDVGNQGWESPCQNTRTSGSDGKPDMYCYYDLVVPPTTMIPPLRLKIYCMTLSNLTNIVS